MVIESISVNIEPMSVNLDSPSSSKKNIKRQDNGFRAKKKSIEAIAPVY